MAKQQQSPSQAKEEPEVPLFRVRPLSLALRESRVGGELFRSHDEVLWVVSQLKLLRHWPLDDKKQAMLESDLDFSKVTHDGETFYELRLDDATLQRKNLRVFFWVHDKNRTIWIIHGYWKKSERLKDVVKNRVARRIRELKGGIQDGSVK
jgi:phage-related protein